MLTGATNPVFYRRALNVPAFVWIRSTVSPIKVQIALNRSSAANVMGLSTYQISFTI